MAENVTLAKPSLVIVQRSIPPFRIPFFDALYTELAGSGIAMKVAAPAVANREIVERGDDTSLERPWVEYVRYIRTDIAGREFGISELGRLLSSSSAVIARLQGSSPDVNRLVGRRLLRRDFRLGLWGHIGAYVNEAEWVDQTVEKVQVAIADRVFAYTPGGARAAAELGADPGSVTCVMNTIDTEDLVTNLALVKNKPTELRLKFGLTEKKTLAYIGGLDSSKRIHFLSLALEHLWLIAPEIKVLVGGSGPLMHLLEPARQRKQVIVLGKVDSRQKAEMAAVSSAVLMPGRIGLVAVDALCMGLPILTAKWGYHAPEVEYLAEGKSMFTSEDNPASYAQLMRSSPELRMNVCRFSYPRMPDMVTNFAQGVERMIANGSPNHTRRKRRIRALSSGAAR